MKDRNGNLLWQGKTVSISKNTVKKFNLLGNEGIVVNSAYNAQQLVTVNIKGEEIDLHAQSLTIIK